MLFINNNKKLKTKREVSQPKKKKNLKENVIEKYTKIEQDLGRIFFLESLYLLQLAKVFSPLLTILTRSNYYILLENNGIVLSLSTFMVGYHARMREDYYVIVFQKYLIIFSFLLNMSNYDKSCVF